MDHRTDQRWEGIGWVGMGYSSQIDRNATCVSLCMCWKSQTIGRAELLAVLKALYEVTMYRKTCIM